MKLQEHPLSLPSTAHNLSVRELPVEKVTLSNISLEALLDLDRFLVLPSSVAECLSDIDCTSSLREELLDGLCSLSYHIDLILL